MNKFTRIFIAVPALALVATLGMTLVGSTKASAASPNYQNCIRVDGVAYDTDMTHKSNVYSLSKDNMSASFKVHVYGGSGCSNDVSVAVWQAPNGQLDTNNINHQKLYYSHTWKNLSKGEHTLTVPMRGSQHYGDTCYYQLDVTIGDNPLGTNGTPWYPNSGNSQDKKFAWAFGSYQCPHYMTTNPPKQPTPPRKNPTPPTQPKQPTQPTQPEQPTPVKPVAKTSTPEQLPNTGPGAVFGLFAGATFAGGAAHQVYARTRKRR